MLRITQNIELAFRKYDPRFSRDLLKALLAAICIHVVLFVVFRIVSLSSFDTLEPLVPSEVEIDLRQEKPDISSVVQITSFPLEKLDPPQNLDFEKYCQLPLVHPKQNPLPLKQIPIEYPNFSEVEKLEYCLFEEEPF